MMMDFTSNETIPLDIYVCVWIAAFDVVQLEEVRPVPPWSLLQFLVSFTLFLTALSPIINSNPPLGLCVSFVVGFTHGESRS